ncbi:MAG: polyprenyl synthetase family protein, partial [Thermoanaerobaculia bacterium]|nr:polyprenyl synthetase family protein [Thermoanaerobaculia bacterium]
MTVPNTLPEQSARAERLIEPIAEKLQLVEEELRRNFESPIKTLSDVGDHILGGGGKRLRPALLLLVSQMLRYEGYRDVVYGAVVEFIHTATLVHDDIIDEAAIRRGRTSINYRWGNHLTVLVGDYLYAHAMNVALAQGNLDVLRLLSNATIRMTEGEILALEQNGRSDITVDEYFDIVGRKTAALFAACCRIPACLVEAPESAGAALFNYGYNLGVCFHVIDDVLDFTSSTEVLG